jgi:membrane-associated phospholipid phosphatase
LVVLLVAWLSDWDLVRTGYWTIQRDWFIALNLALTAWPGQVWSNLTLLGDATVLIPLLSLLIIWRPQAWAAMLAAAPVALVLSLTVKHLAVVPRPAAVLDRHLFTIIGETLSAHNSFPSGHAVTIFAGVTAVLVTLILPPRSWRYWILLIAALLVTVTVGLSRIAIGAHWPLDVPVGALFGLIAGLSGAALARRYQKWWQILPGSTGRCVLGTVVLLSSISLMHRALENPLDGLALWLSGLCGTITSIWLMRGCLRCFRLDEKRRRNSHTQR